MKSKIILYSSVLIVAIIGGIIGSLFLLNIGSDKDRQPTNISTTDNTTNREKVKMFSGQWEYIGSTNDDIGDGTSFMDNSGRHILYVDENKTNLDWAWDSSINFTDGKQLMLVCYSQIYDGIVCFERESDYLVQHKCSNEIKNYVKKLHPSEILNELDEYNIQYRKIS